MKNCLLSTLTLLLVLLSTSLVAQRNCGSMDYLQMQQENNPKRLEQLKAVEQHTAQVLSNPSRSVNGVITIPVVVHVVYNNATENISEAQIQSQIDVLNDDFRRLNADASDTPSDFTGVAADVEIEFCMATVDPQGNATNGITRTSTNQTSFGTNDEVKFNSSGGKDAWPADDYLNIWVCDISGGILGYAQFPGGPASTDGVVVDYQYFGTVGTATAPFDLGRTGTHEVGHYLNLRHIWGDGNCSADDFVSDTPRAGNPNYSDSPCTYPGPNSCNEGSGDLPDMFQNYMDYSDDVCMNLFTQGQSSRMRALFGPGGARESLLNSTACGAAPTPSCSDGIQNGDETGVDCGGSSCPPCNTTCDNGNSLTLTINLDNYPGETSWQVTDAGGTIVASGGTYGSQPNGSTVTESINLSAGDYTFTIFDSYGDGICCSYGNGSYSLADEFGNVLASGGAFGSSEATGFCAGDGGTTPTCNDGIQNGDETGVDCGGSDCPACPTCNDGIQNGDETGVDCGGSDCPACPTCNDGIQNGDETGVDCGGSDCPACPTCNDGIQNGDETGVDCGGSDCPACPTCNDGIQNGDETGVDCGGSCAPCSSNCSNGNSFTLSITLDNYPGETSWQVTDASGTVVASGGTYGSQPDGSTVTEVINLGAGDYTFTMFDSYGDGICCAYGSGSYSLTDEFGNVVASGGSFGASESTDFCAGDNGGGSSCSNGNNLSLSITLDNYPGETSWQVTNAGGSVVASGGTYGSQPDGSTVTESIDLSTGDYTFTIFDSYGDGICCSWGNGSYTLQDEFGNVLASGGSFGSSESTDFCANASTGARTPGTQAARPPITEELSIADVNLFPNPTREELNLAFTLSTAGQVNVMVQHANGQLISQLQWQAKEGTEVRQLNTSDLAPGVYMLHLLADQERITKKFVVVR